MLLTSLALLDLLGSPSARAADGVKIAAGTLARFAVGPELGLGELERDEARRLSHSRRGHHLGPGLGRGGPWGGGGMAGHRGVVVVAETRGRGGMGIRCAVIGCVFGAGGTSVGEQKAVRTKRNVHPPREASSTLMRWRTRISLDQPTCKQHTPPLKFYIPFSHFLSPSAFACFLCPHCTLLSLCTSLDFRPMT